MKKRLLAALLAAAMVTTMAPAAFAVEDDADPNSNTQVTENVGAENGTNSDIPAAEDDAAGAATSTNVAQIGDTQYGTITKAITEAKEGDTIQLLGDCKTATLKAGVTYDLNGQTLTYTSGMTVTNTDAPTSFIDTSVSGAARGGTLKMTRTARGGAAFTVSAGTTFNAQNICIESTRCEGIFPQGKDATLNITNCDMKANWYCVGTNAATLDNYGVIINLKGSTFSSMGTLAVDGTAVYINVSGELNIDDCELTAPRQALMVRAGTANITNSTLKTTGSYSDKEQYYTGKWGSGNEVPAAALVVGNYVNGAADAYVADAVVTVENTKLIGENDFPALYVDGNTAYKSDVAISGDETVVSGAVMKGQQTAEGAVNIGISGGTFSSDVSDYCVSGYEPVKGEDGTYTVEDHRVAEIDGVGYASLQKAFSAAESGATVKLLANVTVDDTDTEAARTTITKPITLDLNGKTIIGPDNMGNNSKNFCMLIVDADTTIIDSANGGGIDAGENGGYCINIRNGATLTINAGKYYGGGSAVQVQKGTAVINGGSFDCEPYSDPYGYKYLINCIDAAWKDGTAKVSITGGVFAHFDPADSQSEHPNGNFCAPGYKAELTNGVYVVKAGTNDAISAIDAALAAAAKDKADGKTEYSDATKKLIDIAVKEVSSIPNSSLTDTTTMGKLDKLDEVYKDANTGTDTITVKVENGTATKEPDTKLQAAKNAALSAADGETITINVDKADAATQIEVANAIDNGAEVEALDITMKKNDGTAIRVPNAPVVLTFKLPTDKANATIYRIENGGATAIPTSLNVASDGSKTISGTFEHFSIYGIKYQAATANDNKYEFTLIPDKTEVSAGDTLTYTVKLKYISGDGAPVGSFRFAPTIENSNLLELQSATPAVGTDVKWTNVSGQYEFTLNALSNPVDVARNGTYEVGKLVYKVKGYGTTTQVVVNGSSGDQVSIQDYGEAVTPSVSTSQTVMYYVTKVIFHEDNSKTDIVRYVPYKGSDLYASLDQMAADRANNKVTAPALTDDVNNTKYRLKDTEWHLNSKTGTAYSAGTIYITDTTYYANTVELVSITLPDNGSITIADDLLHKRPTNPYVDKETDLPFTVGTPATPGMKYDVVVEVNGQEVADDQITWGTDADGKTIGTVKGAAVTGDVTFETTPTVDLTADDIYIFTSGEGTAHAYVEYSKYSGSDTLVLIKGKAGANYTLSAGQPTIYQTDGYKTLPGGEWTRAVLVPKLTDVSADDTVNKQKMLTELLGMGLTATTEVNQVIDTTTAARWDTNGNDKTNRDLGDVQAANDFKSRTEEQLKWTPTDALLLLADVVTINDDATDKYVDSSYDKIRDGQVNDNDVNAFVYLYAKMG